MYKKWAIFSILLCVLCSICMPAYASIIDVNNAYNRLTSEWSRQTRNGSSEIIFPEDIEFIYKHRDSFVGIVTKEPFTDERKSEIASLSGTPQCIRFVTKDVLISDVYAVEQHIHFIGVRLENLNLRATGIVDDKINIYVPSDSIETTKNYLAKAYPGIKFELIVRDEYYIPRSESSVAKATGKVNVRSGPGTSYKRLGKLKKGQSISVLKVENKWVQIVWEDSSIAYVHSDYISFNSETIIGGNDNGAFTTAKATAKVNIRSGPGTEYRKLGQLTKGQQVIVKGIIGDWAQIEVSTGEPAYVHTKYLKRTDNNYTAPNQLTKDQRAWYEANIQEALNLAGFSGKYALTLNSDKSLYIVSVQSSLQESVYNRLKNYGINMNRVRVQVG